MKHYFLFKQKNSLITNKGYFIAKELLCSRGNLEKHPLKTKNTCANLNS